MVCDIRQGDEEEERLEQINEALKKLEKALAAGSTEVVVGANGSVAFKNWKDRSGIADLCAYRKLLANGSWELKMAVAKAEVKAGRKVDQRAVAAGYHSHDDGKTFKKH